MKNHKIVIVDDHSLFADSLKVVIDGFNGFNVTNCLANGQELVDLLTKSNNHPDIVLLDMNMPVLNGIQTMKWLCENLPEVNVLALSMDDQEETIIQMLRHGAKGYLLKDIHPDQLEKALNHLLQKGYYYTEKVSDTLINSLNLPEEEVDSIKSSLNEKESIFLKLACTEKTYREIADVMCLSPKTIDGYRESVFKKFKVSNRVGLVLHSIKNGLVTV
jgi:DNA-binding NarL/FixJ family response regulator